MTWWNADEVVVAPRCTYCSKQIDRVDRFTWRRVQGWERKASGPTRRNGSDIVLRQRLDTFACDDCIIDRGEAHGVSIEHYPGAVGDFCEFVLFPDGKTRCRLCKREYDPEALSEEEAAMTPASGTTQPISELESDSTRGQDRLTEKESTNTG